MPFATFLILWISFNFTFVSCLPRSLLQRRQLSEQPVPPDNSKTTTVVLIISGVVFFLFVVVAVFRKFFYPRLRGARAQSNGPTVPTVLPGAPVVLTAAQLAGAGSNPITTPAPAAPTRRRRPRRTPSQISTKSLPAYKVEAGAQEMVLVRPRHDEMNENDSDDTHEDRMSDELETPLLANGESGHPEIRPSIDTEPSEDSHRTDRSSMQLLMDDRGEAPPYFEVVDGDSQAANNTRTQAQQQSTDDIELAQNTEANAGPSRMSTLRRFLNSWTSPTQQANPRTHAQQPSTSSATSPPRTARHRPSFSASSFLSTNQSNPSIPSLFLSRTRSNSNAPQMSSSTLSIISPPITHTAIRTQFAYPAGGPTPEQMKFVSSTQSLLRFGIPLDAPPSFDEITRHAGSRPRSNSNSTPNTLTVPGQPLSPPEGLRTNPATILTSGDPLAPTGSHEDSAAVESSTARVDPALIPIPPSPEPPHRRISSSTVDTFATAQTRQPALDESDGEETETENTNEYRLGSISSRNHTTPQPSSSGPATSISQ
ncbi:hypothetical protein FRC03_006567 [Tulasnella sp. 419]|nr:hypothetical protein FRC03_006567 [Tulasnella sp. 419]